MNDDTIFLFLSLTTAVLSALVCWWRYQSAGISLFYSIKQKEIHNQNKLRDIDVSILYNEHLHLIVIDKFKKTPKIVVLQRRFIENLIESLVFDYFRFIL